MWTAIVAGATLGTVAHMSRGARPGGGAAARRQIDALGVGGFGAGVACGILSSIVTALSWPAQPVTFFLLTAAAVYTACAEAHAASSPPRTRVVDRLAHAVIAAMAVIAGWLIGDQR